MAGHTGRRVQRTHGPMLGLLVGCALWAALGGVAWAKPKPVLIFILALTLFGAAAHAMVGGLLRGYSRREEPARRVPPEPRLQVDEGRTRALLRERELRELGSYGWIDRDRGVVRIPIDEAMDRLLRRGGPKRRTSE